MKKLECINHVDKRMGTALRKKAKEEKLGGRGYGALTANKCNILQSYYRNAIVKNLENPENMRKAIWASFLHCMSTDDKPQHQNCPQGQDSWCFYNKAKALGVTPPPHKQNVGIALVYHVAEAIKPISERMSQTSLLDKITHGKTQNAIECVNGQIWAGCPKTVHVGVDRVNAVVSTAVSHFNQVRSHLAQVMQQLGVSPGLSLKQFQEKRDRNRCITGDAVSQADCKLQRKKRGGGGGGQAKKESTE